MGVHFSEVTATKTQVTISFGIFEKDYFWRIPQTKKNRYTSYFQTLCSDDLFNHFCLTYCPSSFLNTTTGSAFIFKQLVDAIKKHRAGELINTWQAHVVRRLDTRWHVLSSVEDDNSSVPKTQKGLQKLLPVVEC